MRYTKIPVTIEAERWDGSPEDATRVVMWVLDNGGKAHYQSTPQRTGGPDRWVPDIPPHIVIETLEGRMKAFPGDYVIRGIKGEFYPHQGSFFLDAYEPAEEDQ